MLIKRPLIAPIHRWALFGGALLLAMFCYAQFHNAHAAVDVEMQHAQFDYVATSEAASKTIAENAVGLPLE